MILSRSSLVVAAAMAIAAQGCATKKYVDTQAEETAAQVGERISGVEGELEETQERLDAHDTRIDEASGTAREALERALAAGQLAEGKFLFETVLSDDSIRFSVDQTELSPEAKAALEAFATQIKAGNDNVFVEIQGHTDATGGEAYNLGLGQARAEAVRRYLAQAQGFALHRMSVISYGESAPVTDNGSRQGRAQNRRVVLVVLQ